VRRPGGLFFRGFRVDRSFLCLAVLGEYVVRTHRHTQRRPLYVLDVVLEAAAEGATRSAA
jgi:hypothetical protein